MKLSKSTRQTIAALLRAARKIGQNEQVSHFEHYPSAFQAAYFPALSKLCDPDDNRPIRLVGINHAFFLDPKDGDINKNLETLITFCAHYNRKCILYADAVDQPDMIRYTHLRPEATQEERDDALLSECQRIYKFVIDKWWETIKKVLGQDAGQKFIDDKLLEIRMLDLNNNTLPGTTWFLPVKNGQIIAFQSLPNNTESTKRPWTMWRTNTGKDALNTLSFPSTAEDSYGLISRQMMQDVSAIDTATRHAIK